MESVGPFVHDLSGDADLDHIEDVYLHAGDFWVGFCDDQLVAMGALQRPTATRAEIKRMRIHPDYQRLGFGQAILSALEKRARAG